MNSIRPPEPERRVAPIDGGSRTRVKAGMRREQPQDWLEERDGREEFAEELARQEEQGGGEGVREATPDGPPRDDRLVPQDRVEIAGLSTAPAQAAPDPAPRLDVKV
jgi:hypothetical protein